MLMSQSASSSPTPRSTSRVMMTGLSRPEFRREDCWSGPSHDAWRLVLWNPAEKLGISHGRLRKDGTTFIGCRPRFCGSFPLIRDRHARPDTALRRRHSVRLTGQCHERFTRYHHPRLQRPRRAVYRESIAHHGDPAIPDLHGAARPAGVTTSRARHHPTNRVVIRGLDGRMTFSNGTAVPRVNRCRGPRLEE